MIKCNRHAGAGNAEGVLRRQGLAGGEQAVRSVKGDGPQPQSFLAAKAGWGKARAGNQHSVFMGLKRAN